MAYNEIQVGRFVRLFQKLYSMKAKEPADLTLAPEIIPALSLFHGAENRYLEAWDRFGITFNVAAQGVGNQGVARFRNPAGSNVVVVIEKVGVSMIGLAETFLLNHQYTPVGDLTLITQPLIGNFDSRGRLGATVIISTGVGTGANPRAHVSILAGTFAEFITTDIHEIPVLPGGIWEVAATINANASFRVTCWWRERFLEESERT